MSMDDRFVLSTRHTDEVVLYCARCECELCAEGYFGTAYLRDFVDAALSHRCNLPPRLPDDAPEV